VSRLTIPRSVVEAMQHSRVSVGQNIHYDKYPLL